MANASQEKINKIDKAIVALYGDGKPSEENLSKFLVAFYAKHNVKLTKQKLSQIKSTYKDDVETLISDLLIKYENENPTKQRIQSIIALDPPSFSLIAKESPTLESLIYPSCKVRLAPSEISIGT